MALGEDAERARLSLQLSAAPELHVGWNLVLGWYFSSGPAAREPLGEAHGITYRVGDETDAAAIAPDADVVAAWLAVLAAGDRSGAQRTARTPCAG